MNIRKIKLEIFYVRKAFFEYHHGWQYVYWRFWGAKRILRSDKIFGMPANRDDFSIHILTCHRDLVMTIWSLASFFRVMPVIGQLYVHNDGSLNETDLGYLKKFFPEVVICDTRKFVEQFYAPLKDYPVLKKFRESYSNFSFKKIIDPYFVSNKKFRLIIDSDILWIAEPKEIVDFLNADCQTSLMQANNSRIYATFKDGTKIDDSLTDYNAGIILYCRDNFSLEKLSEFLDKIDIADKRNLHFTDQLGHAYCLRNLHHLPRDRYVIKDEPKDMVIARHYTSPRRPLFYIQGVSLLENILFKNEQSTPGKS